MRDGSTLPRSSYCRRAPIGNQQIDDLVEPNRVLELVADGATLALQALQFSDPEYARLSTNLALELDHPVQVNAYLSPRSARGLDIHFDFHDVVVIQLAGRKRWRIWAPLPRTVRALKRGPAIAQPTLDELGAAILDLHLEPGDCVAIPRGFPHAAETVEAESTHLTIGIMAVTWNRLLRDRVDEIASGTALADRVPFGGLGPATYVSPATALTALAGSLGADAIRSALATEVWRRQPQTRLRPRHPDSVAPLTGDAVRITPGPLLWLGAAPQADGRQALHLGDRLLRFPAEGTQFVIDLLHSDGRFGAVERSELDPSSQLAVLRRLAVEGVVVRA